MTAQHTRPDAAKESPHRLPSSEMVAIHGFLEWFFAGMLASLVGVVGLFALYVFVQLFRNPGRTGVRR